MRSKPKTALVVFGTRPEAIKMAPLVKALTLDDFFKTEVLVTGQHRQMLDQVLGLFSIKPDIDLSIMESCRDISDVTASIILKLRDQFKTKKPDIVLVHGDTATTLGGSLAAFYAKIPIGHVEAGLRTYDLHSPWPEEANRQIVSRIASHHFAPTEANKINLINEGISSAKIYVTGNTVIDALNLTLTNLSESKKLQDKANASLKSAGLELDINVEEYVLVTCHRRENFGQDLKQICQAIQELAFSFPRLNFVFPLHLNPLVKQPVSVALSNIDNIHLIDPLDYLGFSHLMLNCLFALTDSGGLQEELPSLKKPVLVMRNTTERLEAIDAGTVKLVGTSQTDIVFYAKRLITDKEYRQSFLRATNPYGDGFASKKIVNHLKEVL
jgi:UDP-N-acetylglucosamine 2-epimerase (non-hydrolysing)